MKYTLLIGLLLVPLGSLHAAEKTTPPQQVIRNLYLTSLSRLPSESETAAFTEVLRTHSGGPKIALQDIFWAVLNSNEFIFNH